MSGSAHPTGVVPACLSFLAIYNPSLSTSEESLHDQIVYYHSKRDRYRTGRKSSSNAETEQEHQDRNERLRQIGLAQGMVEFAKYIARSPKWNKLLTPILEYSLTGKR